MTALSPAEMLGQRLLAVTASLHEYDGLASQQPVHAWMRLDRSGHVQCRTAGSGDLALLLEEPYEPYDMQQNGRILVVNDQPPPLAAHTGEVIQAVTRLRQEPPGMAVGILMTFQSGLVAIANLGDELIIDAWPGTFRAWDVVPGA